MKNILLLTDFSKSADNAISYALSHFNSSPCHFFLMYVYKSGNFIMDDLMTSSNDTVFDAIIKDEKQELEHYKSKLTDEYKQHQFSTIIDYDDLLSAISQSIELNTIDLIVAGYDGATSLMETVFGSNTLKIIRNIEHPTLIVPEEFHYQNIKNVLIPLDESDKLNTSEFDRLLKFIDLKHTNIQVLRIDNDDTLAESDKLHLEEKAVNYTYNIIKNVALPDAVMTYQQLNEIDLVGLIIEKESFLKRLISESSTTKISKSLNLPLLIVHN
ncbi:universal stress protein [Gaetbulibacter jejuensis]|uniref:Universal stress protein n=1 Tax=Gaetbulibacter jejuensis TaxID=584607 RepID=A0ABP3V4C0_9FLAO